MQFKSRVFISRIFLSQFARVKQADGAWLTKKENADNTNIIPIKVKKYYNYIKRYNNDVCISAAFFVTQTLIGFK